VLGPHGPTAGAQQQPVWEPVPELCYRWDPAIAYDPVRQRSVLFGGRYSNGHGQTYLQDTWEWDGTRWSQRTPLHSPPGRSLAAMAFDPVRGTTILFGGADGTTGFSETWEWDGRDWSQIPTVNGPPASGAHRMATDPVRRRVVTFLPGRGTWEWDGTGWTGIQTPTTPPTNNLQYGFAFDPTSARLILFGGARPGTWAYDGTTWTDLRPAVEPTTPR